MNSLENLKTNKDEIEIRKDLSTNLKVKVIIIDGIHLQTSGSRFLKMYILVFSIIANNSGLSYNIKNYTNLVLIMFHK
jgi:hypothetical protein